MELRYRRRTPRQEAKLARLEEIRQSREHLGDPTPLPTTVQGAFHWDLADQVNALTDARLKKPERSFMLRMLALCSLPRIDPGDESVYIRTNGPFELVMSRGGRALLPYGNLPRLLLAWICTDTVRTKSRRLELGASLSEFMDRLNIQSTDSGGRYGVRTRLQKQMIRLFSASISLSETHERGARGVNAPIVDTCDLWWDNNEPRQAGLWNSYIVIGERFFEEILGCPVPINMNVLHAMRRSPLGIDIYLWLTYRLFLFTSGRRRIRIRWTQLYDQFGARAGTRNPLTIDNFRKDFLRELKKLAAAWPELTYATPRGYLELFPTPPLITPAG